MSEMFDFNLLNLMPNMLIGFMSLKYMLWVALPSAALSGGAAWLVKSRFAKYSKVPCTTGYTGQMAAQKLLDVAGITDVEVVRVDGMLTDHYNPTTKKLALSSEVFDRTTVAAIGVATHEAGHAIQHATGYYPLKWRSAIVPAANIGTKFGTYGMMIGGMFIASAGEANPFGLGMIIFGVGAACLPFSYCSSLLRFRLSSTRVIAPSSWLSKLESLVIKSEKASIKFSTLRR